MAFCEKCGSTVNPGAAFCSSCGAKTDGGVQSTERVQSFDGTIHKCPRCGEVLESFTAKCPSCGYELRGTGSSQPVKTFAENLNNCHSDAEKIALIKSFPIPNTKEDIMEFMIIAHTNFDSSHYVSKNASRAVAEAWMVKMDQCIIKTKVLFSANDPAFLSINEMYERSKTEVMENQKKIAAKKYKLTPGYWVKIIYTAFAIFMTLGSFISGSIISGLFGILSAGGTVVSISMGLGMIPTKYSWIQLVVFLASVACFVPLIIFLN